MVEEFKSQESAAPFNLALSTLESLRAILSHIERLECDTFLDDAIKQKIKINLLKRFYVDSSPLLKDKIVEKYRNVLKMKPKEVGVMDEHSKRSQKKRLIYDQ